MAARKSAGSPEKPTPARPAGSAAVKAPTPKAAAPKAPKAAAPKAPKAAAPKAPKAAAPKAPKAAAPKAPRAAAPKAAAPRGPQQTDDSGIEAFELDVRIAEIDPEIWRRVLVPADIRLGDLHIVLQLVFDWENEHLHQFRVGRRVFDPNESKEYDVTLAELAKPGNTLFYEYDLGDGWDHIIKVLARRTLPAGQPRFQCLAGERRGPAENSGGPAGYSMLLDDLLDESSEGHAEAVDQLGADFDPEEFDRSQKNAVLAEAARRLSGAPAEPTIRSSAMAPGDATDDDDDDDVLADDLVLLFVPSSGDQAFELPSVFVKADAPMLERLGAFFTAAAAQVQEQGEATPDLYFSDFMDDEVERPDLVVTQEV